MQRGSEPSCDARLPCTWCKAALRWCKASFHGSIGEKVPEHTYAYAVMGLSISFMCMCTWALFHWLSDAKLTYNGARQPCAGSSSGRMPDTGARQPCFGCTSALRVLMDWESSYYYI